MSVELVFRKYNIYQMFFFIIFALSKKIHYLLIIKEKPFNLSMYEKDYVY